MSSSQVAPTGVRLTLRFPPTSPLFLLCTPLVEFDGMFPQRFGWGSEFVPMSPGKHTARAYYRFLGTPRAGDSLIHFEVQDGRVTGLRWWAPVFPMLRGRWRVRIA